MNKPVSLDQVLIEQMKDPECKKEFDSLEREYDSERVRIEKRIQSNEPEEKSDES
jgi:hypothetical protein